MCKAGRDSGFTLMELIVVIAIILLLISIVFPLTGRVIGRAGIVKCKSNQRTILQGAVQYSNEVSIQAPLFRFHNATVDAPHEGATGYAKPEYPGNPAAALFDRTEFIRDAETFFCPLTNIDPETAFSPYPLDNPGTWWGSYCWWYPHVPRHEETPPRNNSTNVKPPMPEAAKKTAITDFHQSFWENNGYQYKYEHYNVGMWDGSVQHVADTEAEFRKWIYR